MTCQGSRREKETVRAASVFRRTGQPLESWKNHAVQQSIVTLDMEGVLTPEIWIAVAEKAANMAVVPGDFGWSDVGSFEAISEVRPNDARGNVLGGARTLVLDSDGCVVLGGKRLIAVVGLKDVVVVDSGDALFGLRLVRCHVVRQVV